MNITLKETLRKLLRLTFTYKCAQKRQLSPFTQDILQKKVKRAIKNVPFYKGYFQYLRTSFSIKDFPIIRKKDIIGHESELVSKGVLRPLLMRKETGGSTGMSLELFYSPSIIISKNVLSDYAFSLIGKNLRIATLRGQRPANNKIWQNIGSNLLLSSYQLSEKTVDTYLGVLKEKRINCLHVYPSSLSILTRLIKAKYGKANLPELKGIVASSEIFSKEEKLLVQSVFPHTKIVDLYGHNELVCCAIAVDDGFYKFFNNYGYVEFAETGEKINEHRIAEIIATSIMNTTMPFIRYGTEDYVELDANNNVVSIIGRTSDFVVNKDGELVPCIVLTRDISMQHVTNFQYYQPAKGKLTFRVIVNDQFTKIDQKYLLEDMEESFNGLMDCTISVVNHIEKTKIGKQKRLIQKLNLNEYR